MAIDSRAKRFSAMAFGSSTDDLLHDPQDGSIGAADRASLLLLYGGILLDEAIAALALFSGRRRRIAGLRL